MFKVLLVEKQCCQIFFMNKTDLSKILTEFNKIK